MPTPDDASPDEGRDSDRDEQPADSTEESATFLRKRGVRKRMRCSGQVARRIEDAFVTAEQLVDAVESDQELAEHDGIGPKTAEIIEDWWENRFEREDKINSGSIEPTGSKSATIHFHESWNGAIGERPVNPDTDAAAGRAE